MDPDEPGSILISIIFLLFLSGFFSGAEVALVSTSPAKARSFAQQKRRGGVSVNYLKNHPDRLLITILIGNNLVNILISVLSTVAFTAIFGNQILGILTGVLTLLVLIFGEIIPKSLAQRYSDKVSLISAPVIVVLAKVLLPIVWIFEQMLHKLAQHTNHEEKTFSDEELLALAEIGEEEGGLESDERERIEGVLEFGETTAEEVMTPRPEMDILPNTTTLDEAVAFFLERTHSRIPVYENTIDKISSILTLKNVLKFEQNYPKNTALANLPTNPPLTVPTSMALEDVLKEMKWRKTHMAIVIDEHGGTAGLVTLEDMLEEVFGEIEDETDREEPNIKKLSDGSYLILGSTEIEEILEETGIEIPGEDETTRLAKVLLDAIGRFPKRGESIAITDRLTGVVEKMNGHKIHSVRLFLKKRVAKTSK